MTDDQYIPPEFQRWIAEMNAEKKRDETIPGFSPRRSRAARSEQPRRPQGELAGHFFDMYELSPNQATAYATAWAGRMFTASEAKAWLEVGLRPADAIEAEYYREAGLQPRHMRQWVRGETMLSRLRGGRLSARQVVELLKREGMWEKTA